MGRSSRGFLLASLAGLTLVMASCTVPEGADDAEVQQWMDTWNTQDRSRGLGTAAALLSADVPRDDATPEGITLTYPEPVQVGSLEFSCFGAESAQLTVQARGLLTVGMTTEPYECATSPHTIPAENLGLDGSGLTELTVDAVGPQQRGAWGVAVLGTDL